MSRLRRILKWLFILGLVLLLVGAGTFGVLYWLVYNASTGFNGGNPTGFSAGAGNLDSTPDLLGSRQWRHGIG